MQVSRPLAIALVLAFGLSSACSPRPADRRDQTTVVFQSEAEINSAAERALAGDAGAAQALSDHYWPISQVISDNWLRVSVENGGTQLALLNYAEALRRHRGYCNLLRARFALNRALHLPNDPTSNPSDNRSQERTDQMDPDIKLMLEEMQGEIAASTPMPCANQLLNFGQ